MFGKQIVGTGKHQKDEAEKPFWISYADLMTAMMVLFLVVMVASLSSVTQRIQAAEQGEKLRGHEIAQLCSKLQLHASHMNKTIVVDCHDNRISFGEAPSDELISQKANIITVTKANKDSAKTKELVKACSDPRLGQYISGTFGESVLYHFENGLTTDFLAA